MNESAKKVEYTSNVTSSSLAMALKIGQTFDLGRFEGRKQEQANEESPSTAETDRLRQAKGQVEKHRRVWLEFLKLNKK